MSVYANKGYYENRKFLQQKKGTNNVFIRKKICLKFQLINKLLDNLKPDMVYLEINILGDLIFYKE
jgi:hypothetical protein